MANGPCQTHIGLAAHIERIEAKSLPVLDQYPIRGSATDIVPAELLDGLQQSKTVELTIAQKNHLGL